MMSNDLVLRIAKAPMRISFIGGGSDFKEFYSKGEIPGRVLGTTINKHVYVMASEHPTFEPFKYKFTYRKTEEVNDILDFEHPVVRATLESLSWKTPLNLATMASLPGRSGLGSSSAFTVALLAVLRDDKTLEDTDRETLALDAIRVERNLLKESGGVQDQFHAAFGGFRLYEFKDNRNVIHPRFTDLDFLNLVDQSLYLVASGPPRSSDVHSLTLEKGLTTSEFRMNLEEMSNLALSVYSEIQNLVSPADKIESLMFGMRHSWELKKRIGVNLSGDTEEIISAGVSLGAETFKLCGAGGSGFVAFMVPGSIGKKLSEHFGENRVFQPGISDKGVELNHL